MVKRQHHIIGALAHSFWAFPLKDIMNISDRQGRLRFLTAVPLSPMMLYKLKFDGYTPEVLLKFNIVRKKWPSQKEGGWQNYHFLGSMFNFGGGNLVTFPILYCSW